MKFIGKLPQTIFTAILAFPLIIFAQSNHEGHSMQSHSLTHWLITILILVALIGVIIWFRRRKK
jgi:membrane protein DedA with SNARE-associated domain